MEHLLLKWIISMEYWYHVLTGPLGYCLDMLEKIQKQVHYAIGPTLAETLVLQKNIIMWSVLVSSIGTLLEDAHLSYVIITCISLCN